MGLGSDGVGLVMGCGWVGVKSLKILGQRIWVWKQFESGKKIRSGKRFGSEKRFWSRKKSGSGKNLGLEQHLGPKNNLGPEKNWVLKLRFIYFKHLRWLGTVAEAMCWERLRRLCGGWVGILS